MNFLAFHSVKLRKIWQTVTNIVLKLELLFRGNLSDLLFCSGKRQIYKNRKNVLFRV